MVAEPFILFVGGIMSSSTMINFKFGKGAKSAERVPITS